MLLAYELLANTVLLKINWQDDGTMSDGPQLTQFRIEPAASGLIHLVFDAPHRSMNVFSNVAIKELGRFSDWLKESDVRGVVIRSGKSSGFCAGADLLELAQAYDMIMHAQPADRFGLAFEHFFPLSQAIRALETSGKPIAAAIAGVALGGGCELAMGAHYRVLADTPTAVIGLPESVVGLLPGGGGTQRLPRLVAIGQALSILLEDRRLSGSAALYAGLVDKLVPAGDEVVAAEHWLLTTPSSVQPWDRNPDPLHDNGEKVVIAAMRDRILSETLGHYPAPLAILDCVEQGLFQPFDEAIHSEMTIFSHLIQRPEPRDMIATLFAARLSYDRHVKTGSLPLPVEQAAQALGSLWQGDAVRDPSTSAALAAAGFSIENVVCTTPDEEVERPGYWFNRQPIDSRKQITRNFLLEIARSASLQATKLDAESQRLTDYALVSQAGFPAYLGGPFAYARNAAGTG